jgi:hypothetical protein
MGNRRKELIRQRKVLELVAVSRTDLYVPNSTNIIRKLSLILPFSAEVQHRWIARGRVDKLVLDISDSELEAELQMVFENDRVKKKERKQEREELRAQGLLGKTNGKPDLKQSYKLS